MSIRVKFEPRDLWIGVYWNVRFDLSSIYIQWRIVDVYVCIVPMLPIHVTIRTVQR